MPTYRFLRDRWVGTLVSQLEWLRCVLGVCEAVAKDWRRSRGKGRPPSIWVGTIYRQRWPE